MLTDDIESPVAFRNRLVPGEGVWPLDESAVVPDAVEGTRYFAGVEKLGSDPRERSCKVSIDGIEVSVWALSAADMANTK